MFLACYSVCACVCMPGLGVFRLAFRQLLVSTRAYFRVYYYTKCVIVYY